MTLVLVYNMYVEYRLFQSSNHIFDVIYDGTIRVNWIPFGIDNYRMNNAFFYFM